MNYKTIASAVGWYFRDDEIIDRLVVWPLAVWATTDAGEIVGLIALKNENGFPKLDRIRSVAGVYLQRDQLSADEFEAAKSR